MTERQTDLEALHEIAVASSGVLDPDALGRMVMERTRTLLEGDEATLLWWDPAANGLRILGATYVRPFPRIVKVGEGAAGIAFRDAAALVVEDYPSWEHAIKESIPRGLKTVAAVPLIVGSQPVGALTVSFNRTRRLTNDELRLLTLIATQVAPALEAARLHGELVHLSKELEATNAELVESNRHKSAFLANMSHELRTPLNAIIGFSELLTDARESQFDPATHQRFLNQILSSGRHLLGLINDILDLSKVEVGEMQLSLQKVSVAEIVEQALRTVEPLVAKKSIHLESHVEAAGDVVADAGKLRQMLLNLLSNAIKFTPDAGSITVSTIRSDYMIEISVADNGIGISESDQKMLFKEFQQLDQGTGRKQEGTGLGLALTRRLAQLHGGEVRVSTEINRGSVFTLSLPDHGPPVGQASGVPAPALPNGKDSSPLVLIVEDEPAAAELLARHLVRAGYRTHAVRTGEDALAKARELQPSAITLDIVLPDIDGWEIINRLKQDEATSSIPIVVVSVVDSRQLGMALGAIDYFVKPINAKELIKRLNRFRFQKSPGQERARILVVDDDAANRTLLAEALEPAGFTVVSAAGGREGIELAKSQKPDLVLLDLMMPEVSGFDVVEALRASEATREMPIMVLTAATLTEDDKRLLNGRVLTILSRGSVGAADIVGLLKQVVATKNGIT